MNNSDANSTDNSSNSSNNLNKSYYCSKTTDNLKNEGVMAMLLSDMHTF